MVDSLELVWTDIQYFPQRMPVHKQNRIPVKFFDIKKITALGVVVIMEPTDAL
jgi:hypothetical protein